MPCIDGFVIACPEANKRKFSDHASMADPMFIEMGALRVIDCRGNDVPDGKTTDFRMAMKAQEGEAVLFSWKANPDKATRDDARTKMLDDPSFAALGRMPFDAKHMIVSGFVPVVELSN